MAKKVLKKKLSVNSKVIFDDDGKVSFFMVICMFQQFRKESRLTFDACEGGCLVIRSSDAIMKIKIDELWYSKDQACSLLDDG